MSTAFRRQHQPEHPAPTRGNKTKWTQRPQPNKNKPAGYDWFCDERSGRYRVYFPADETEVLDITGDVTPAAIEELLRERSEWCPDGAILGYIEIDGE